MSIKAAEPRIYEAMREADRQIKAFDLDPKLLELIKVRVSQINGCGYCIHYHAKDARKAGETEERLYALSAWWETPFFTDEEQAVLKLAEEVTRISEKGVSGETFEKAASLLGQQKVAQVIFAAMTIGNWNRIAISTHMVVGVD